MAMKNGKYRVGAIGCGLMGIHHASAYAQNPMTEIVAAADTDAENLQIYCDRFNIDRRYGSYEEMLQKEDFDIAAPVLPTGVNPGAVLACAKAGVKAIFCEKPMAASLEDADRMVAECRSRGVKLAAGDAWRNFPQLWTARGMIEAGEIGEVRTINTRHSTSEISGGGCQGLNVTRMFAGDEDVDWIVGWVDEDPFSDEDQGMGGCIHFTNGVECFLSNTPMCKRGVEVLGSRGAFYTDFSRFYLWKLKEGKSSFRLADLEEIEGAFPDARSDEDQALGELGWPLPGFRTAASVQAIVDSLENDTEPRTSGDDMRKALEIGIALRESHRRGHSPVKLPLEDRTLQIIPKKSRLLNKKGLDRDKYVATMELYGNPRTGKTT